MHKISNSITYLGNLRFLSLDKYNFNLKFDLRLLINKIKILKMKTKSPSKSIQFYCLNFVRV